MPAHVRDQWLRAPDSKMPFDVRSHSQSSRSLATLGQCIGYRKIDDRVDRVCIARLTLVCCCQSRLSKSTELLNEASRGIPYPDQS